MCIKYGALYMIINNIFSTSNIKFCCNKQEKSAKIRLKYQSDTFERTTNNVNKDYEKYKQLLDKIYNAKDSNGKIIYDSRINLAMYPDVSKKEEGVLIYAGVNDEHDEINRYLSGRPMQKLTPELAEDMVQVIDFSLKEIDKKYGKYNGIVYRQGIIPNNNQQYISTSTDPIIAATLYGGVFIQKNLDFAIIKTRNGHKINEFQRDMDSEYAENEEEILLPRTTKLKEIKEPNYELLNKKRQFVKILEQYAHRPINPSSVHIYEEI